MVECGALSIADLLLATLHIHYRKTTATAHIHTQSTTGGIINLRCKLHAQGPEPGRCKLEASITIYSYSPKTTFAHAYTRQTVMPDNPRPLPTVLFIVLLFWSETSMIRAEPQSLRHCGLQVAMWNLTTTILHLRNGVPCLSASTHDVHPRRQTSDNPYFRGH